MYPILYAANETAFTSNGIGMLSGCVKCIVEEERNGTYECEFDVLCMGRHFDDIDIGKIILVPHDDAQDLQPFVIYRKSVPINGIVTFNAHHISYRLANVVIAPFTTSGIADTFNKLSSEALTANPFTFWTSKSSAGTFSLDVPTSARAALGGTQGSVLDVFGGGEYEWDKFAVKLRQHRGSDTGVTIRYGKNLTKLENETDASGVYNAAIPYWQDSEDETDVVYGSIVQGTDSGSSQVVVPLDMSDKFEDKPTVQQLEAAALSYLNSAKPWMPSDNLEISFVALWQTEEYKNIASLERVKLCDTVHVYYPELGVNASMKVIKTTYNVLTETYDKIELGDARTSFAGLLRQESEAYTNKAVARSEDYLEAAMTEATQRITGGLGGHVVIGTDANGKPQEIFIMDTESTGTAVNVLRINVNGIGFSSSGVNGPYTSAWTLDGAFVANFITTGYLSCNRIKGGTLTLGGADNGDGYITINDANDDLIAQIDKDGIIAHSLTADDYVYVFGQGGSRIYTPANVTGVYVPPPTDPAYVDLSNRGLIIQTQHSFVDMADYGTINTVYPADSAVTYSVYDYGQEDWVDISANGVVSATIDTGTYESELVDHTGWCTYVLNGSGGPAPDDWFTFDTTTVQATEERSFTNNYIQYSDSLTIETTDRTHWTAEYKVPPVGSPLDNWLFRLDESAYTRQTLRLRPWMLSMAKTVISPSTTQGGQTDHVIDNFYVNLNDHEVSISGDHKWSFDLNGTNLATIAEQYPNATGHVGAPAIRVEAGMSKYMSLGVNATTKILYVYGGNTADSLSYIGRVQLT